MTRLRCTRSRVVRSLLFAARAQRRRPPLPITRTAVRPLATASPSGYAPAEASPARSARGLGACSSSRSCCGRASATAARAHDRRRGRRGAPVRGVRARDRVAATARRDRSRRRRSAPLGCPAHGLRPARAERPASHLPPTAFRRDARRPARAAGASATPARRCRPGRPGTATARDRRPTFAAQPRRARAVAAASAAARARSAAQRPSSAAWPSATVKRRS